MKTLRLPLNQVQDGAEMLQILKREELKPGDKLEVLLDPQTKAIVIVGLLLLIAAGLFALFHREVNREKRVTEGSRILDKLFAKGNPEALEEEIEAAYGIDIEVVTDEAATERNDWQRLAMQGLASSYGDDEPDYSDAVILKPNPDYKLS